MEIINTIVNVGGYHRSQSQLKDGKSKIATATVTHNNSKLDLWICNDKYVDIVLSTYLQGMLSLLGCADKKLVVRNKRKGLGGDVRMAGPLKY